MPVGVGVVPCLGGFCAVLGGGGSYVKPVHDKVPPYTAGRVMGRDEEPWTRHRTHVPLQREHRVVSCITRRAVSREGK